MLIAESNFRPVDLQRVSNAVSMCYKSGLEQPNRLTQPKSNKQKNKSENYRYQIQLHQ